MKKYPKSIKCSTQPRERLEDDLDVIIGSLKHTLDDAVSQSDYYTDSGLELLIEVISKFNKELKLDLKLMTGESNITSASDPDATYRNKKNPNKFIETKKYKDGHRVARQYMKWDTPEGEVKNYTGARDAKRGRYFRTNKDTLDSMLEDYEEVDSATDAGWGESYRPYSGASTFTQSYYVDGYEAGFVECWNDDGDFGYTAYVYFEDTGKPASIGTFDSLDEAMQAVVKNV